MRSFFKASLILGIFNLNLMSFAADQTILVAHQESSISDYKTICKKNNYLCFPDAFSTIHQPQIYHFNELMLQFDLDDPSYLNQFEKKLWLSLKEDDLNLDQIKNLILASEKIHSSNKRAIDKKTIHYLTQLHTTLIEISEMQNNDDIKSTEAFYIAGKMILNTYKQRKKIEPFFDKIKSFKVDSQSVTVNNARHYFLNGDCQFPRYTDIVHQTDKKIRPFFPEGCHFEERYDWGKDLISNHLQKHKNKYLIAAATFASLFFVNSYQVSIGQ